MVVASPKIYQKLRKTDFRNQKNSDLFFRRQKIESCKSSETRVAKVSRRSEPSSRGKRTFEVSSHLLFRASIARLLDAAVSGTAIAILTQAILPRLPEQSTEVGWTIIDRTERIIEPIEPNFERPFTPRTSLRSARNFGNARFRRFANFDFLTSKKKIEKKSDLFPIFFPSLIQFSHLSFPSVYSITSVRQFVRSQL